MSVYIPGMEMPHASYDCPLNSFGICNLANDAEHSFCYNERPKYCPLVEIKTPHGRMIDAEAFDDYMQNRYDNNELTNGDWIDFRLSLKDQTTIIEAEGGEEDG